MLVTASDTAVDQAAELLSAGQLVAFPTETVYGLGANAWDETAVRAIFRVKGRPATNPLIIHVASTQRLAEAVAWPLANDLMRQVERLSTLWPGPLTLILPKADRITSAATAGRPTVAVRVPAHPVALELLRRCDFPVAAPSANRSTYVSPTRAEHVAEAFVDAIPLILDGGSCKCGLESTILSLVDQPPRLLRHGVLTAEELAERLHVPLSQLLRDAPTLDAAAPSAQEAPGMLREHYAPHTPVAFRRQVSADRLPQRCGLIAFQPPVGDLTAFAQIEVLSPQAGDLQSVAQNLFAALRRMDDAGLDLIVVEECPEVGLGRAIMDRLRRASARSR